MSDFSFDEWAKLYKEDPIAFECKRKETLEAEILKAPIESRIRLRLIQMECDAIHDSMSPMEATIEMTNMAVKKLQELKAPLTQLRSISRNINNLA
jgi:hypothetical protein